MAEILLTLRDVEERLVQLSVTYELTSEEFERNAEARRVVSEEDQFEWEAYLHHRAALLEQNREVELHRDYIYRVTKREGCNPMTRSSQAMLAA